MCEQRLWDLALKHHVIDYWIMRDKVNIKVESLRQRQRVLWLTAKDFIAVGDAQRLTAIGVELQSVARAIDDLNGLYE